MRAVSRPHIAYLFSRYPVVSQTFCDSEMLALEQSGVRISVASLNAPPTSFRHERLKNLKAELHYPPPAEVLRSLSLPDEVQDLVERHDKVYGASFKAETRARNAVYFGRFFTRLGVEHVHVHFANRATHTALFLKKLGFSFSFTAHAQDFMVDLGSDDLLREMARESEFVIAVSEFSRSLLAATCPESAGKIHRVYNGLRPDDFAPPSAPAVGAPLRLVSVGRLIEFKGFHHLIEALSLATARGLKAELHLIGDGPWRGRLEELVRHHGLDGCVHFRGVLSQEQIKAELARSDIFVLPCCVDAKGASDILPTVIMEAMAARLPVISTRVAGVPEMVESGTTGLLVEPDRPDELAAAISRLAGNRELRRTLGEAGRLRAVQLFSLDQTTDALGRHFVKALAGREPRAAAPAAQVLILLDAWPAPADRIARREIEAALAAPGIALCTGPGGDSAPEAAPHCPQRVEFLPDAIVLESLWKQESGIVAAIEALYQKVPSVDGEDFFRAARRAVWLADLVCRRGITHLHAFRANDVLPVWIVKQLTGLRVSFAVESGSSVSRTLLAHLLTAFDFGSLADEKLAARLTGKEAASFPDTLALAPLPAPRGLLAFAKKEAPLPAVDFPAWFRRLVS